MVAVVSKPHVHAILVTSHITMGRGVFCEKTAVSTPAPVVRRVWPWEVVRPQWQVGGGQGSAGPLISGLRCPVARSGGRCSRRNTETSSPSETPGRMARSTRSQLALTTGRAPSSDMLEPASPQSCHSPDSPRPQVAKQIWYSCPGGVQVTQPVRAKIGQSESETVRPMRRGGGDES